MNINDLTVTSLETITAFDVLTGDYKFTLDELQNATIDNTEDTTDITGKAGRKLTKLKRNKAVKITGANGLVSGGLMSAQTGGKLENKVTEVMWTDYLTVDGTHKAKTAYKAIGTPGAEIESLFVRNADGTQGAVLKQNSSASDGEFAYAPSNKEITFHTNVDEGTEIVVYYKRKIKADTMENVSDVYSEKCALYVDALAEDKCSAIYRIQFYIPKADFSGNFSIEMGDNQTVHSFEAEALAGACGTAGQLWTYTVFGANAADAE